MEKRSIISSRLASCYTDTLLVCIQRKQERCACQDALIKGKHQIQQNEYMNGYMIHNIMTILELNPVADKNHRKLFVLNPIFSFSF